MKVAEPLVFIPEPPIASNQQRLHRTTMANKDPTLFTATSPVATAKPTPKNTRVAIGGPAPPGETPLQKVARLREAARKARAANESPAERLIERGRLWADRAHRFTTLSLIGFTGMLANYYTVASARGTTTSANYAFLNSNRWCRCSNFSR